jgi:hypothetical protein
MSNLASSDFSSVSINDDPSGSNYDVFPNINNASQNVQDKYLEGVPFTGSTNPDFPGPFFGTTTEQQNGYQNEQHGAINNYENIATTPLGPFSNTFPANDTQMAQDMSCNESYPNKMRMFPTFNPNPDNTNVFERETGNNNNQQHQYQPNSIENFKDDSISDPCNQTGFGKILPEFVKFNPNSTPGWTKHTNQQATMGKSVATDNYLTQIQRRPVSQFSHNNMVPMYGAKLTQNMRATGVPQAGDNNSSEASTDGFADQTPWKQKLANFTGCDDMWMHKRETETMFSPAEQQTGWVNGSPAIRPDLDRYKTNVWQRNNESPVEKIQVGPGIGLDYNVPAAGGHQQFTRILPNNVDNYKSNQLEGRVHAGKWAINHPTSQYINGVNQKQSKVEWTQARRPTMGTKFSTNAPSGDSARLTNWNVAADKGKLARTDTEISGGFGQLEYNTIEQFDGTMKQVATSGPCVSFSEAPVGMTMGSHVPAQSAERDSFNSIRPTLKKGAAGYDSEGGYWECDEETQGSNRWGLIMGPGAGAVPNNEQRDGWFANLTDRGEINPYVINVSGTVTNPGGVWSPNSFQDEQKVTTKQTSNYTYQGGPSGEKASESFWSDSPKVTTKSTTNYSHQGGPSGIKSQENTWTDKPRVTTRETTHYAHQGGTAGSVPALGNRFMFTGSDYINPDLEKNAVTRSQDSVLNMKTSSSPLADFEFAPGLSKINRENFTTMPAKFGLTDFFNSSKLLIKEAFGEVETFTGLGGLNETLFGVNIENYGEEDTDGNKYFDPDLFNSAKFKSGNDSWKTHDISNNGVSGQWQKGGMTSNGLRGASEVRNHFPTPGRSNILPDPCQPLDTISTNPSRLANGESAPICSIGTVQTRGTKQIAGNSTYGPGSLMSTNIQIGAGQEVIPNDINQGYVRMNDKRSQFVDYRSTAPFLVNNLRTNPLSIYATNQHVNDPLPEFFNMVTPDNFSDYVHEPEVGIMPIEKQLYVNGSPQSTILGLEEENPFLGMGRAIPNTKPTFSGKSYSAKKANTSIYNIAWTDEYEKSVPGTYTNGIDLISEGFANGQTRCKNKALDFASKGYFIENQINNNNFIQWGPDSQSLPYGPKKAGNVLTQVGGLWSGKRSPGTHYVVNRNDYPRELTDNSHGTYKLGNRQIQDNYIHGLPGSLIK